MFRINKLTLYSFNDEEYTYEFSMGINYGVSQEMG